MNVAPKNDRLVWVDLEMTGLDPDRHVIVEIAALVTDANLQIIGEGVDLVIHHGVALFHRVRPRWPPRYGAVALHRSY